MKKKIAVLLCAGLSLVLASCGGNIPAVEPYDYSDEYNLYESSGTEEYISLYQELEAGLVQAGNSEFQAKDYFVSSDTKSAVLLPEEESKNYGKSVLSLKPQTTVTFRVETEKAGGYHLSLDYFLPKESLRNLELSVWVNGKLPYKEASAIELPAVWKDREDGISFDEYKNQIYPAPERIYRWQTGYLNNSLYQLETPLIFWLEQGENQITIQTNQVPVLLGKITLSGKTEVLDFQSYKKQLEEKPAGADEIILEGEKYAEKSESYIRGARSRNVDFEPYDYQENLINTLDGSMWASPSRSVTYEFEIKTPGVYYITMKYQQSIKSDMPVFKNIYVDGKLLFDGLSQYRFDYTKKNKNHCLTYQGEKIGFYFEQGVHTVTLESTASKFYTTYETLLKIIERMNDIGLEVKMITGNKSDRDRDWQIEDYIPDLKQQLEELATDIERCYATVSAVSGKTSIPNVSNLLAAASEIRHGMKDLDDFVNNINHFSQGDGAITDYVANVLPVLLDQPLTIDRIYIGSKEQELPAATKNPGRKLLEQIRILGASYFGTNDSNLKNEKDKVNIWVNMSSTHIEILRQMVATYYGEDKVNISAMPDESKLLLSVTAGTSPDAAIGVSLARPFDFALRGAAYNLRQFKDFPEVMKDFTDEMFVPFTLNGGVYALPQNATFYVLFYRTDIIEKLGLSVPSTWDEVVKLLPVLNRYGMNFNTILSAGDAYKPFAATVPIIQQFGGRLYSEDGSGVGFGDKKTVEAFTFMTDLFTRYSLPISIPNFYYNFKNGITPIGISEINTYNLLTNAAPEIYGQWEIAPSVGILQEDETICNVQPSVATGCLILNQSKKKEEAWEFLKWWMSEETQLIFSNMIQLTYGPEYLWNTANLNALSQYTVFKEEHKEIILNQLKNTKETPRIPAYYQVERDLSNAWNQVVIGDKTAREAIDKAILTSNRAIRKKYSEFGFMDENGNWLKPFELADPQQIREWRE